MRRPALAALASAAALALSTVALAPSAGAAPSPVAESVRNVPVCPGPVVGSAGCDAIRHERVDANGKVTPNLTPAGHGPTDIQSVYGLPAASTDLITPPSGPLVAIVDAYDDPNAEKDLGVYRNQYQIPPCTSANGCFTKVNQNGTATLPRANGGWAQEISLDLDMVSAACPNCRILLVEASSTSFANLATAVTTAFNSHAVAISNSYGGSDTSDASYSAAYNHPGVAVTASTGDSGYGPQSPATFGGVVAVGGTSLKGAPGNWTESAWSGAGSGCSAYNIKPAYQNSTLNGYDTKCQKKADADVSAVADPNTGVSVYDSYAYQGASGWLVFGGTSASSPIIASVFALGGVPTGVDAGSLPWKAAGTSALHDVTSGSNGTCSTSVWCTSGAGWDGPTGLGTPNGTGAF